MRSNRGRMPFPSTWGIEQRTGADFEHRRDATDSHRTSSDIWSMWNVNSSNQPTELPSLRSSESTSVCIVVENLPVPVDRRVWCEARALRDAGYIVSVICPKGKNSCTASYE